MKHFLRIILMIVMLGCLVVLVIWTTNYRTEEIEVGINEKRSSKVVISIVRNGQVEEVEFPTGMRYEYTVEGGTLVVRDSEHKRSIVAMFSEPYKMTVK